MRIMTEQECALVEAHMALVETVIQRHITVRPDIPGLEHDDLFQVGSLALCRAAQRYVWLRFRALYLLLFFIFTDDRLIHCRDRLGLTAPNF